MSVRTRTAAAMILATLALNAPALAQGVNGQLTADEQIAAQNFNGIDISTDSLGSPAGSTLNGTSGQISNSNANGAFNNSMCQNGLSTNLNSQNTQLGQGNTFGNAALNNGCSNEMNGMNQTSAMNGYAQMNAMNGMSNMNNGFNNGMNNMAGGMMQNTGMNNNSGGIAQTIGNTIMNDPKMMQRAVGVAGAAALFGLFVTNGGVGGMMRSAGMDNTRHIRGPGGGY